MNNDALAMLIILPIAGVLFLLLAIGAILVVRDTVRQRGKWGINTKQIYCPRCDEPAPAIRKPKNRRQMLWGGCTCAECGLEYDKWGRAVAPTSPRNPDEFDE